MWLNFGWLDGKLFASTTSSARIHWECQETKLDFKFFTKWAGSHTQRISSPSTLKVLGVARPVFESTATPSAFYVAIFEEPISCEKDTTVTPDSLALRMTALTLSAMDSPWKLSPVISTSRMNFSSLSQNLPRRTLALLPRMLLEKLPVNRHNKSLETSEIYIGKKLWN